MLLVQRKNTKEKKNSLRVPFNEEESKSHFQGRRYGRTRDAEGC